MCVLWGGSLWLLVTVYQKETTHFGRVPQVETIPETANKKTLPFVPAVSHSCCEPVAQNKALDLKLFT